MGDLRKPKWMILKAVLLVVTGMLAALMLLADSPSLRTALLLCVAIWTFARAYYFAFYVIERYIDPAFRFAGVLSAVRYVLISRRR